MSKLRPSNSPRAFCIVRTLRSASDEKPIGFEDCAGTANTVVRHPGVRTAVRGARRRLGKDLVIDPAKPPARPAGRSFTLVGPISPEGTRGNSMGEDAEAANYDPARKIIRSLFNGRVTVSSEPIRCRFLEGSLFLQREDQSVQL